MEGTTTNVPVFGYLSETFPDCEFTLVDIGCSGGIDPVWRSIGPRLRALGIDPVVAEIERLKHAETHPGIRYLAGLAGLPPDHPLAQRKGRPDPHWRRNPWDRLSTAKSFQMMRSKGQVAVPEMLAANRWSEMKLSEEEFVVPTHLRDLGITSVDFLKIDVDGPDFEVLNSFDLALHSLGILGVGVEVAYYGSACDTDHAFHNVDRFMKARGFEIFNMTVRRYSVASLPSRYVLHVPAQTEFGRPREGDALYIRDLGSHEYDELSARLPLAKLINLIRIFAAFNLPDCASEIVLRFRDRLGPSCDADRILDLLALQAQGPIDKPLSYREYLRRFEAHDPMFFPQTSSANGPCGHSKLQRLRRMWFRLARFVRHH